MEEIDDVRQLPAVSGRVETGATRFGSDWTGLFVRGDDAFNMALAIGTVIERLRDSQDVMVYLALGELRHYKNLIERDVVVRHEDEYEPGQVVITFKNSVPPSAVIETLELLGGKEISREVTPYSLIFVCEVAKGRERAMVKAMLQSGYVEDARRKLKEKK